MTVPSGTGGVLLARSANDPVGFGALAATKVLPMYALLSTIVAAISAIASAAAAHFAYARLCMFLTNGLRRVERRLPQPSLQTMILPIYTTAGN